MTSWTIILTRCIPFALLQLPSSSSKFVNMTKQALEQFAEENNFKFKKITEMPLEGDGTIRKKVSRYL